MGTPLGILLRAGGGVTMTLGWLAGRRIDRDAELDALVRRVLS